MVNVKIRGVAGVGAKLAGTSGLLALGPSALGCGAGDGASAAHAGAENETRSTTSAITAPAAAVASATLELGYGYGYGTGLTYELWLRSSTTDEYLRTGEAVTLRIPASLPWTLLYPTAGYPDDVARGRGLRLAITAHYLRNGAEIATADVGASDAWAGEEFYNLSLETATFVLPPRADAFSLSVVVTDVNDPSATARIGVESVRPTAIVGADAPNKTWLLDTDNATRRQRVLEGGAPVRSAALALAYTDYRANTVSDALSTDREIGTYQAYGRFGQFVAPMTGEIVHEVAVGIDLGDGAGFRDEQPMAPNTESRLVGQGRTVYETRIAVGAAAQAVRAYVHIKSYLVVDYTRFSNVITRRYTQGQRILVRETWDQPNGVGSNYELPLEDAVGGTSFKRTVVLIKGVTSAGQNLFLRGGIDHVVAVRDLGRTCTDAAGRPTYDCALPFVPRQYRNATTAPWKGLDLFLDWYGRESAQKLAGSDGALAEGSAADWTSNEWPGSWGAAKTVARDGYGVTPINVYGAHYWMVDADIDCAKAYPAADGTRWFEVKSYITGGPGWEPDVRQPGAPFVSKNHLAQCGAVSIFERGVATARFATMPVLP